MKVYSLEELNGFVTKCRKCELSKTRTNTVFGQGNSKAKIVFVGEGPL